MTLEALIQEKIRASGPVTIAEYMSLALSHPEHGYYMRRDPFGAQGDFITAPEISQIFGELIGAWLASQWIAMGKPQAALAEFGPGRGTLMLDALRATQSVAGFHEAISVHLVETSPGLRQKQWETLAGKHPAITWHADVQELPKMPLLFIANEFFDALPVRQFIYEGGWKERMVGLDETGHFSLVISEQAEIPNHQLEQRMHKLPASAGMTVEYCEAGEHIMRALASHIAAYGGAGLVVDYGYIGGSNGDTLQAVRQHHYHDILSAPGTADLTCHVDFAALAAAAKMAGAELCGPVGQGLFLTRIGGGLRLKKLCERASDAQKSSMISGMERLISLDQMGDLFKVLCLTGRGHPAPEGF